MEKANGFNDPGGEESGAGSGGLTLTDEDAGFDSYVDGFNEANRGEAGPKGESEFKPVVKRPAPAAPTVNTHALLGTAANPIHSKTGGR